MPATEMDPFVPTPTFPPTVVAFGDSLTAGVGASSINTAYPSLLSNWLGLGVINEGVSGNTTANGLARINTIIAYDPDVVILFLGGNDILQRVPLQTTVDNLAEIIRQLKGAGAHVVLVGVHDSTFQSARETAFRNLAQSMDVFYVPNALRGILGNRSLMADLVHPNDDGYRLLADRIYKVVADALNERYPDSPLSLTCEVWPESVFIGRSVTWTKYSWGAPGTTYSYSWAGDGDLSGSGTSIKKSYATAGTYTGTVTARSGDTTVTRPCRNAVTIAPLPLVGHCEVALSSTRSGSGFEIAATWKAVAGGGTGEYSFSWSGSDGLTGDESTVKQVYTSSGTKQGTVTVRSGSDTLTLPCSIAVTPQMVNATTSAPLTGGCTVRPGDYAADARISWTAQSRGGVVSTTTTYRWRGDGPLNDSTLQTVAVTYDTTGMKTGTVTISRGEDSLEATCNVVLSEEGSSGVSSGDGCFIATAAYGSAFEPHVATLRAFRDERMSGNAIGEHMIAYYYKVSPPIAERVSESETLRVAVRALLYPVVFIAGLFL
jgi:acyl-CoA thioesterase I